MEAMASLMHPVECNIYSEFSVDNILQHLHDETKKLEIEMIGSQTDIKRESEELYDREDLKNTLLSKVAIKTTENDKKECELDVKRTIATGTIATGPQQNDTPFYHPVTIPSNFLPDEKTTSNEFDPDIKVQLGEESLWNNFHHLTNEMILTKTGRRMFPVMKVKMTGLDPDRMYSIIIDFVPSDNRRWKFVKGKWTQCSKCEQIKTSRCYTHPDSPNYGSHWMKSPISFSKIKLSNKENSNNQVVILHSLHKYTPRIHVMKVGDNEDNTVLIHTFKQTEFVAVTAYQNEQVTSLKIKNNPFAKAFLDAKGRTGNKMHYIDSINPSNYHHSTASTLTPPPCNCFDKNSYMSSSFPQVPCHRHSLSHLPIKNYNRYPYENNQTYTLTHAQYPSNYQPIMVGYNYRSMRTSPYTSPMKNYMRASDFSMAYPDRLASPMSMYNFPTMPYNNM